MPLLLSSLKPAFKKIQIELLHLRFNYRVAWVASLHIRPGDFLELYLIARLQRWVPQEKIGSLEVHSMAIYCDSSLPQNPTPPESPGMSQPETCGQLRLSVPSNWLLDPATAAICRAVKNYSPWDPVKWPETQEGLLGSRICYHDWSQLHKVLYKWNSSG